MNNTVKFAPGPKKIPILGNALDALRDPLGYFTKLSKDFGDVVAMNLGSQYAILVNRPDLIEQVLIAEAKSSSREFNKQSAIGRFLAGGDQIYRLTHFPAEGGFFERERTYMAPSFHKRALFQYADTMAEIDERYIENLKDGEERSIHEDMKAVTLEAVGKTLFSINNPSDLEVLLAAFEIVLKDIGGRVCRLA